MISNKYMARGILFIFFIILVGFIYCTAQQAYSFIDRKDSSIVFLEKEIVGLKYRIEILESCCRWELILFDILSSQEKLEMDAIEETLERKRQRAFLEKGDS